VNDSLLAMLLIKFLILIVGCLCVESRVVFPNVPDVIDRDSLLPEDCKRQFK
jgi:hypothetical protein